MCGVFLFNILAIVATVFQMIPSYTLAKWTGLPLDEYLEGDMYIKIFVYSIIIFIALVLLRSIVMYFILGIANTNIHNKMAERVIRSPILFFDSNPIGRISTRFSKDLVVLDMMLPGCATLVV